MAEKGTSEEEKFLSVKQAVRAVHVVWSQLSHPCANIIFQVVTIALG